MIDERKRQIYSALGVILQGGYQGFEMLSQTIDDGSWITLENIARATASRSLEKAKTLTSDTSIRAKYARLGGSINHFLEDAL